MTPQVVLRSHKAPWWSWVLLVAILPLIYALTQLDWNASAQNAFLFWFSLGVLFFPIALILDYSIPSASAPSLRHIVHSHFARLGLQMLAVLVAIGFAYIVHLKPRTFCGAAFIWVGWIVTKRDLKARIKHEPATP